MANSKTSNMPDYSRMLADLDKAMKLNWNSPAAKARFNVAATNFREAIALDKAAASSTRARIRK
jgi:hypothetical protein